MNKPTSDTKNTGTQQDTTRNTLRIVVMFYVGYLAYSIFQGYLETRDPLLLIAALVFAAVVILFFVISVRQWVQKRQAAAQPEDIQDQA